MYPGGSAGKRIGLLGLLQRNIAANCSHDATNKRQIPSIHEVWWGYTEQLITGKHIVLRILLF
jgi:hypothetical protein